MVGKPKLPKKIATRIRKLAAGDMGKKAIAAEIGCSVWSVRKVLDPDFAERERARQRAIGPQRWIDRKDDEAYQAYQAEQNARPERKQQIRTRMAALRASRKPTAEPQ